MANLPRVASIYIFIITLAWVVIFYAYLKQRDQLKKNKSRYDLRTVHFEIEPIGDEAWRLNFFYGQQVLHSEIVSESDILNDKAFFYKSFIKWCEEEK